MQRKLEMTDLTDSPPATSQPGCLFLNEGTGVPDAAVLAADGSVLAGGVDTHVVEGGLPHQVVRASELSPSVGLFHHKHT